MTPKAHVCASRDAPSDVNRCLGGPSHHQSYTVHMASKNHTRRLACSPFPTCPKHDRWRTSTRHPTAWRGVQWRRSTASLLHLFQVNGSSSEGGPKRRIDEPMPMGSRCDMDNQGQPNKHGSCPCSRLPWHTHLHARMNVPTTPHVIKEKKRRVTNLVLCSAVYPKGTPICVRQYTGRDPHRRWCLRRTQRTFTRRASINRIHHEFFLANLRSYCMRVSTGRGKRPLLV